MEMEVEFDMKKAILAAAIGTSLSAFSVTARAGMGSYALTPVNGSWLCLSGTEQGYNQVTLGSIVENRPDSDCAYLQNANLSGMKLDHAGLRGALLKSADLSGASCYQADMRWATLKGAKLQGADLEWAQMNGADLTGADLSDTLLYGTNFSGAKLDGAALKGARYNNTTKLPFGDDEAAKRGMINSGN